MFNPILETENDNPPGPDGCRSHDVEIVGNFFSSKYGRNEITLDLNKLGKVWIMRQSF